MKKKNFLSKEKNLLRKEIKWNQNLWNYSELESLESEESFKFNLKSINMVIFFLIWFIWFDLFIIIIIIILNKLEDKSFIHFHKRINAYYCHKNVRHTFFWNFTIPKDYINYFIKRFSFSFIVVFIMNRLTMKLYA